MLFCKTQKLKENKMKTWGYHLESYTNIRRKKTARVHRMVLVLPRWIIRDDA